jgi:uncharacterized protein YggE
MMKTFAVLSLLALATAADAGPPYSPGFQMQDLCSRIGVPANPRQITVTGTATLEVTPDLLDVRMSLTQIAPRPAMSMSLLRGRQAQLIKSLPQGATARLSNLSLYPQTDDKGRITGYQSALEVTVTTKDFDQLGDIAEAAAAANATGISTAWRRSDLVDMKDHVRVLALQAARAKVDESAKTLGFNVGQIDSINENAGNYWGGNAMSNAVENNTAAPSGGYDPAASELTLTVTITYEIS